MKKKVSLFNNHYSLAEPGSSCFYIYFFLKRNTMFHFFTGFLHDETEQRDGNASFEHAGIRRHPSVRSRRSSGRLSRNVQRTRGWPVRHHRLRSHLFPTQQVMQTKLNRRVFHFSFPFFTFFFLFFILFFNFSIIFYFFLLFITFILFFQLFLPF